MACGMWHYSNMVMLRLTGIRGASGKSGEPCAPFLARHGAHLERRFRLRRAQAAARRRKGVPGTQKVPGSGTRPGTTFEVAY